MTRRHALVLLQILTAFTLIIACATSAWAAPTDPPAERAVDLAFSILTAALVPLVGYAIWKAIAFFEKRSKIDLSSRQEDFIHGWGREAIHWVEEQSRKRVKAHVAKWSPPEKLEAATRYVLDLVDAKGWDNWTREMIEKKIEALVNAKREHGRPDDPPPAAVAAAPASAPS